MPLTVSRRTLLSGAGGLAAATILRRPAHAAEFSYKFASVLPPDHPMMLRCTEAIAKIKEQSGGKFEITLYPNSALGADTSMLAQCVSGAVEMYALQGDLLAPRVPAAGIIGVGFAFPSYKEAWPAIDGELGDFVRAQAEKSNMICLKRAWDHGFREITSRNKPINSPADLKGFKIRLPVAPIPISLFKHLGAAPTAINFSEVYSALQTGVVDGQENPLVIIDAAKLYEVEKYCALTNHQWACYHVAFNMDAWKRLPQNLRDMAESVFDAAALLERDDWVKSAQTLQGTLKGKGMIFTQPDMAPFRAELTKTGFYPEMKAKMGDQAWTLLEKYVGTLASSLPPDSGNAALLTRPPSAGLRRVAFLLDRVIGTVAEAIGAVLVLAEVTILFCGVVARYVFDAPLIWSDELATFLFLWLCMLGAVVALRRGGHMRLTTLVAWVPPAIAAWFESIGALVVVAFVLEILLPAKQYVDQQVYTELTTLDISDAWRAAAILVGGIMAAVIAVLRLLETAGPRALLAGAATVGAVALALWLAEPLLIAMGRGSLVLFFIVIVGACVAIGVPIAFAFGISTVSYLALTSTMPISVVVNRMDDGMSNLLLLSVPMFVFLGLLMEMTGIARVMVNFLASLLGHVRGGLSYVLLGAMYLVSGISGSKAADMAAVAPVLFPEMRRRGTHPGELACLLASSSAMSETIPPSLVLITIGSVTNVSIAALFTGGLLPAAVAALALVVVAWWRSRNEDTGGATRPPARFILRSFVIAVPGLTLPFVIRFAVMNGIATATEVSTVGVIYTALLGAFVYRHFDLRRIYPILVETLSLTGAVMLIIGTATAMAWALTQSGFSQWLVRAMATVPGGKGGFLAISMAVFIVLGSALEGIPAIVLFGPLLFPVARALGVNEVHYAIVVILAMGIGLFAPPFGVGFFSACAIGRVSPDDAVWRIWPYLAALVVALAIVAAVPWLSVGFL